MKTICLSARIHSLAVILIIMVFAPFAHAVTDTPLDCPGVIADSGGYHLTGNATCSFFWDEDNKAFNLKGFTLKGGPHTIFGANLKIYNGVLQTNAMHWEFSDNGTLSDLEIRSDDKPSGFFIEAGNNFTVKNCVFKKIKGVVLDYFFGDGGTVKNSVFIGNETAISIQKSSNVVIERNTFLNNAKGVNLSVELGAESNNNIVQRNFFHNNGIGINMLAERLFFEIPSMQGNQIIRNRVVGSALSGILIKVMCLNNDPSQPPICPAQGTTVRGNDLRLNGFKSITGMVNDNDDGLTARGVVMNFPGQEAPYPESLAVVTLTNNHANQNADLGFDVYGVTDGGKQKANANTDPLQCVGVQCDSRPNSSSSTVLPLAKKNGGKRVNIDLASRQYRHTPEQQQLAEKLKAGK